MSLNDDWNDECRYENHRMTEWDRAVAEVEAQSDGVIGDKYDDD